MLLTVPAFQQLQADSFRDLYLGRWIAAHGIPHREVWAIANSGRPWIDQQWLSDLLGFRAWSLGGYPALAILDCVFFGLAYGVLAALMRWLGASIAVAIAFASFAAVSAFTLTFIRAEMLSLPLLPVLIWICIADSRRPSMTRLTLLIVPLLVVWANVHGSVLLGAAIACGYLGWRCVEMARARRRRRALPYLALTLAAALSVLATPYGLEILRYYSAFVGNHAIGAADLEWDSASLFSFGFFQMLVPVSLALLSIALAWRRGGRPSGVLVWSAVVTAVAALLAIRNNVWLGMTTLLLAADAARVWFPTRPESKRFVQMAAVGAVLLGAAGLGRLASERTSRYETLAPGQAVAVTASYAEAHPRARIIADAVSVSALLWKDPWLAGRVGFDGRIELYPQQALLDWVAFQHGSPGEVRRLGARYQLLLASDRSPALKQQLDLLPGASVISRDSRGIAVWNPRG